MSQLISNLAVGSCIWISEDGADALYELAGFNVHGTGTATFVRKNAAFQTMWGSNDDDVKYSTCALDAALQAFESNYLIFHRGSLVSVSLECVLPDASKEIISRRVFAPSRTEISGDTAYFGGYENSQLTLYGTAANRIKHTDGSSTAVTWWLRTMSNKDTTFGYWRAYNIQDTGDTDTQYRTSTSRYAVPAFAIPSSLSASDTATDGGYTVSFPDTIPQAVPTTPVSSYVDVGAAITFEWDHVNFTGTSQTKADLQYRIGSGEWQTLTTVIGDSASATIPANTFPAGQLWWRVRTYNSDNVAGDWSPATAFIGVGVPAAPTITEVTQCSRPVVSWTSLGQAAYQVQIGDYDTGEIAGTVKTYKLPHYIPNDTYTVRVRIKNASLLWSAWAETTLVLSVTGPATPSLTASATTGAASLALSATGAEKLYLLRNGVPIVDVTGLTAYIDYAALGAVSYVLRAVDASDNYTDSAAATITVTVSCATVAAVDALSTQVALVLTRGEPMRLSGSINQVVTYQYFAGRSAPVAVYSGQERESYQVSVACVEPTDRNNLIALLRRRKTILYRDSWGNRWYVSIAATGYEQDHIATSLSLSMTVVDHVEQIEYSEV